VFNLIPFPGTKIFKQAIRDKLFVKEIELESLWEGSIGLNADDHNQFYIQPYAMTIEELIAYRRKFDDLRIFSDRAKILQQNLCIDTSGGLN
jgi:hypothetical protein